jgi:tetratricopeptide (TPR) repeat protein
LALKLLEKAAEQPPEHPILKTMPNIGVAEAEHALGVRYFEGISVFKDLSMAVYWYQRATDHGSAMAANNLGSMYLDGLAVGKDLEKAEQLHELAAKRGDPVAMLTLAEIRLGKNDFQMAKIWYDHACKSGNVVAQRDRDKFIKTLEERQKYSSDELKALSTVTNYLNLLQSKYSASVASGHSFIKERSMLREHANRGSVTAKQLCAALEHFVQALYILVSFETLSEEQEDIFVHELSQCYRIEQIVVQIPATLHKRVSNIIERVLSRCTKEPNSIVSQLDEDVRLCYAILHFNSYGLIEQFLTQCKEQYPKSMYFFLASGAVNGFRRQSDAGLYDINNGLEIEPDNCELLYHKAILLRHIGKDMDEAIKAYQKFLTVAPKDHRKVPEAHYEMAICYMKAYTPDVAAGLVLKLYKEGKEAEKLQLPCFLPYRSDNIAFIQPFVDIIMGWQI